MFDAKFDKLIIDSIDTVTALDRTTSEIVFIHDEIKEGSIENGGELTFGTGAHGKRVSSMYRNKTSKLSYKNAYVVASSLAAKIGANITEASSENKFVVPDVQFAKVDTDESEVSATLKNTPIIDSLKFVYAAQKDMTQGEKLLLTTDFTVSGNKITFTEAGKKKLTDVNVVIVPYEYEATVGKRISNDSEKYAKNVKLIVDLLLRDVCDNSQLYHAKMVYYNCAPDMNNTISIGDEPAVEDFSAESMVDPCSADKLYWDMYIVE